MKLSLQELMPIVLLQHLIRGMAVLENISNVSRFLILFDSLSPVCLACYLLDLDHTADVQCHCWGKTLQEAFEHMVSVIDNR